MFEIYNSLIGQVGGAAIVITGLSAWLGSIWKDRISLREKAAFEVLIEKLKSEHSRQTQNLESALQTERHLVQLGHANLIEKRAVFIDESYKLLVDLHEAIYETIRPDYFGRQRPSITPAYESALPKFDAFVEVYEKNKIYFLRQRQKEFHISMFRLLRHWIRLE